MKKFFIINFSIYGSTVLEQYIDNSLKEVPFNHKTKMKARDGIKYDYVFILCKSETEDLTNENYLWHKQWLEGISESFIPHNERVTGDMLYSVYLLLQNSIDKLSVIQSANIDFITEISEDSFNITYTDGSFRKADNKASYACCVLNNNNGNSLLEEYTGKEYSYDAYSGLIDNATNNIGELTAIKIAAEKFNDKKYQIIIADSEYSIKAFREWYYTWKNNDFKNYAGKKVKNEELIKSIFEKLFSQEKIIFFKWTASHVGNAFNEKCDELAKHELGIKKRLKTK